MDVVGAADELPKFYKPVVLALIGAILIGLGVFGYRVWAGDETKVEVIESGELKVENGQLSGGDVVLEVAGAVIKPGVYKLVSGSRVDEALISAGGMAANADRTWVEKYVNRAEKVKDGQKIYIPATGEMEKIAGEGASTSVNVQGSMSNPSVNSGQVFNKININTASQVQLESLWGIGPATAGKIISGRPYSAVEELLSRKIVKSNVYEAIRDQVSIY